MIKQVKINECTCEGCGHVWLSRKVDVPRVCPHCGNRKWNKTEDEKRLAEEKRDRSSDLLGLG